MIPSKTVVHAFTESVRKIKAVLPQNTPLS